MQAEEPGRMKEALSRGREVMELNRTQWRIIKVYLPFTFAVILLEFVLDSAQLMWLLKYLVVFSLFLWSFLMRKRTRLQERLSLSLLFVAVGDAFLYLPMALGYGESAFIPYGMGMFLFAYGCLIGVYGRDLHIGWFERQAAFMASGLFILGLAVMTKMDTGTLTGFVLVFWGVLCTMLWTALCARSPHSPYRRHGRVIALSGILMVVCDAGVGLGLFYPAPSTLVYNLAESVVWAAYIPAWMLIAWLVAEERLLSEVHDQETQGDREKEMPGEGVRIGFALEEEAEDAGTR